VVLNHFLQYRGELAAATAAAIWAGSSIIYSRMGRQVAPLLLNLTKGVLAIGYLAITILATGDSFRLPAPAMGLLLLSGWVGIAIGDTLFFGALNRIGARLTLLINTMSPVATALLAELLLGEHLLPLNYVGIAIAVGGVAGVIADRTTDGGKAVQHWQGVGLAIGSALSNSLASILSRQAMTLSVASGAGDLSPVGTTFWRLVAGTIGILLLLALQPKSRENLRRIDRAIWLQLAAVAFFSTFIGISLQQTALKYTAAGIAQTIGAISPLFVMAIDWSQGVKVGWKSLVCGVVSIGGLVLLFVA
jgi:drug/metabolite transporter (DMT)-like permease